MCDFINTDYAIVGINKIADISAVLSSFKDTLPTLKNGVVRIDEFSVKVLNNGLMYTYEDAETQKGFVVFYANDQVGKIAYLSMIAVKEQYRGEHIGTKLLNWVEIESFKLGMSRLRLEVNKQNNAAIDFYKRRGFTICEEKTDSYYMHKALGE